MNIITTPLDGLVLIELSCFQDARGYFVETYQDLRYRDAGISSHFVQDNQSRSVKGVLRGLHFQIRRPQAKLVTVMRGAIFDVGVDVRPASPTFGQWFGAELSDAGQRQLYMAPGFAHGFCVLSDWADVHYKVTERYDPADEAGLRWDDPDVGIAWPIEALQLAPRDAAYPVLRDIGPLGLPHCVHVDGE